MREPGWRETTARFLIDRAPRPVNPSRHGQAGSVGAQTESDTERPQGSATWRLVKVPSSSTVSGDRDLAADSSIVVSAHSAAPRWWW